ncbi:MAG: 2-oxoacid:acceptor oxidoreductase subunit alpha, partial [Candidatus Heimdallarchaeota archaeon]|nr:2-oxoacid:acceptor oxidoreductase subunit alpha [Candidatus Heimdallarchaeota archaeon]
QSTGLLMQKYFNSLGYSVFGIPGTQSTIRGGHVWQHLQVAITRIDHFDEELDVLFALNKQTLDVHFNNVKNNGIIITNSDIVNTDEFNIKIVEKEIHLVSLPLTTNARNIESRSLILANTIAMGVFLKLFNLPIEQYHEILKKRFAKNSKILEYNLTALQIGFNYNTEQDVSRRLGPSNGKLDNIVINGNQMIALGAAASGLKFLAQYPITPASSILTYLAMNAAKFGIIVRQAEDELAAINMIIGASFGGARAMTASSGPGISLMAEAFGYASMTETPIVVVNSMRAGPSTGIPTKMEQADLLSMISLSHGESPRAIFAPRNIEECFELTVKAFNVADKYQIPVIILSDFALSEQTKNIPEVDLNIKINRGKIWQKPSSEFPKFKRFQFTEDGISPRAFPPTPEANYILVGAEHDEESHSLSGNRCGLPNSWTIREKMIEKRFKKVKKLEEELDGPEFYGSNDADYTIICWGSTQGAVNEAVDRLNKSTKYSWNSLSFSNLFPIPIQLTKEKLQQIKYSIMFEINYTNQFEQLLYLYVDWKVNNRIKHLNGETSTPNLIIKKIFQLEEFKNE